MARRVDEPLGTEPCVHARRDRAPLEHVIHAPVPGMTNRECGGVVAVRDLPARAGGHCSPPTVMMDEGRRKMMGHVVDSSMKRRFAREYLKKPRPSNF